MTMFGFQFFFQDEMFNEYNHKCGNQKEETMFTVSNYNECLHINVEMKEEVNFIKCSL